MALVDNLSAFYELGDVNDAHGSNHLTNHNGVTFVPGKVGNAAEFDAGSSQRLSRASNASLQAGDIDFTIATWFRTPNAVLNGAAIVAKGIFDGNLEYALLVGNGTTNFFRFALGFQYAQTLFHPLTLANSTYYFCIAWLDAANNTVNVQVNDGTVASEAQTVTPVVNTDAFTIGARSEPAAHLTGQGDQLSFWKRVLTAAERTWLYNSGNGRSYAEVLAGMSADRNVTAVGSISRPSGIS
jgi:Concanavalin A-like lectin/glucanases superfamily